MYPTFALDSRGRSASPASRLPTELLRHILSVDIDDELPRIPPGFVERAGEMAGERLRQSTIIAATRVNRAWHAVAEPLSLRRVYLSSISRLHRFAETLPSGRVDRVDRAKKWAAVRVLVVGIEDEDEDVLRGLAHHHRGATWHGLRSLLLRTTHLRSLLFTSFMPIGHEFEGVGCRGLILPAGLVRLSMLGMDRQSLDSLPSTLRQLDCDVHDDRIDHRSIAARQVGWPAHRPSLTSLRLNFDNGLFPGSPSDKRMVQALQLQSALTSLDVAVIDADSLFLLLNGWSFPSLNRLVVSLRYTFTVDALDRIARLPMSPARLTIRASPRDAYDGWLETMVARLGQGLWPRLRRLDISIGRPLTAFIDQVYAASAPDLQAFEHACGVRGIECSVNWPGRSLAFALPR